MFIDVMTDFVKSTNEPSFRGLVVLPTRQARRLFLDEYGYMFAGGKFNSNTFWITSPSGGRVLFAVVNEEHDVERLWGQTFQKIWIDYCIPGYIREKIKLLRR